MTRRRKIQLISLTVAIVLVLGGTTVSGYLLAAKYRSNLEYSYRRALSDLGDYVSSIETTLTKAVYANTAPQQNGIAARLMRESSGAKSSLAVLPLDGDQFENMSRFIAQVGDFSMAISNKISSGGKISEDEYKTIQSLEAYAKSLQQGIADVEEKFSADGMRIGQTEQLLGNLEENTKSVFNDNLEAVAKDFSDYPQLIYDGPFSDSIGQKTPKLIEGKAEIPQGNAENIAAEFLGADQAKLQQANNNAGGLPTYNFSAGGVTVCVTRAGGVPVRLVNDRAVEKQTLGYQEALKLSQDFLKAHKIENMKESYYFMHDGKCTINYAYTADGVTYYPDLIKVSVAMDNGEIVEYDATGYIMNHTDRKKPSSTLTQAQAQKSVSPHLTVKKGGLAVIPTPGLNEVLCYEFLCESEDEEQVLVYINADEGYEQEILILLFSDNGVLTQ